jgi:hypothetical protein
VARDHNALEHLDTRTVALDDVDAHVLLNFVIT